jgi:hypothetical protein
VSDKHTPGPWKAERCSDVLEIGAETPAGHLSVAWIHGFNPGEDVAAVWADARLLAAAPELLEALRLVVEAFARAVQANTEGLPGFDVEEHALVRTCRAAIAKAEGREP